MGRTATFTPQRTFAKSASRQDPNFEFEPISEHEKVRSSKISHRPGQTPGQEQMRNRNEADGIVRRENYREAARSYSCPTCGAEVGQRCTGASGKDRVSVHQARGELVRPRRRYDGAWASQIEVVGDANVEGYVTYGIRHKATGRFGYVGQTGNFSKRIQGHARGAYLGSKKRVARWLKEILDAGGTVEFLLLEQCESEEHSLAMETKWVGILAREGHFLTNRWLEHQKIIKEARKT